MTGDLLLPAGTIILTRWRQTGAARGGDVVNDGDPMQANDGAPAGTRHAGIHGYTMACRAVPCCVPVRRPAPLDDMTAHLRQLVALRTAEGVRDFTVVRCEWKDDAPVRYKCRKDAVMIVVIDDRSVPCCQRHGRLAMQVGQAMQDG